MTFALPSYWRSCKFRNKKNTIGLNGDPDSGDLLDGRIPVYRKYPTAFTLTLKRFFHDKKDQLIVQYVNYHLRKYCTKRNIYYVLYPELTKQGVLHWHGYIQTKDHVAEKLFVRYCTRYMGMTKAKLIDNVGKWNDYVIKDHKLMEKYYYNYAILSNGPPRQTDEDSRSRGGGAPTKGKCDPTTE